MATKTVESSAHPWRSQGSGGVCQELALRWLNLVSLESKQRGWPGGDEAEVIYSPALRPLPFPLREVLPVWNRRTALAASLVSLSERRRSRLSGIRM